MSNLFHVTWSTRREGNDGYVLEIHSGSDDKKVVRQIEFGPIPPHVVPTFVEARRRIVADMMKKVGAHRADDPEDWSILGTS